MYKRQELDDGFWEDLEDTLISADTGIAVAENVVSNLKEIVRTKKNILKSAVSKRTSGGIIKNT